MKEVRPFLIVAVFASVLVASVSLPADQARNAPASDPNNGGFASPADIDTTICSCPCHGDPRCDGVTNVFDVILVIQCAIRDCGFLPSEGCPVSDADVYQCDNIINIFDVVYMVDAAFRNADPDTLFCEPCPE